MLSYTGKAQLLVSFFSESYFCSSSAMCEWAPSAKIYCLYVIPNLFLMFIEDFNQYFYVQMVSSEKLTLPIKQILSFLKNILFVLFS